MSDANWSPAMARQDISNQQAEHNAAMADETYDRNDWDHDDRTPTRAEADADMFEDWLYDRNHGRHN
jgi:hypothetical protein